MWRYCKKAALLKDSASIQRDRHREGEERWGRLLKDILEL